MPFKPKGTVAQWITVYEFLVSRLDDGNENTVITWAEWEAALGFDIRRARTALYRAQQELLYKYNRTVESVHGEGYRMDRPSHRISLIKDHEKRGMANFGRAEDLATHVPQDLLTVEQQAQLDLYGRHLMLLNAMVARETQRINITEANVERVDERLSELEQRLERLGILPKKPETLVVEGEVVATDLSDE